MKKTKGEYFKKWKSKMTPDENRLYNVYHDLIQRCYNKHCKCYPRYGGRGIGVCDEWRQSWRPFVAWGLSHGYRHGLQIDRIDNNGNYCPENCRFVTRKENCRNRRDNRHLTLHGETHLLCEWSERTGISRNTLQMRIDRNGWSVERALTTPVRKVKRRTIEKLIDINHNQNTNEK